MVNKFIQIRNQAARRNRHWKIKKRKKISLKKILKYGNVIFQMWINTKENKIKYNQYKKKINKPDRKKRRNSISIYDLKNSSKFFNISQPKKEDLDFIRNSFNNAPRNKIRIRDSLILHIRNDIENKNNIINEKEEFLIARRKSCQGRCSGGGIKKETKLLNCEHSFIRNKFQKVESRLKQDLRKIEKFSDFKKFR